MNKILALVLALALVCAAGCAPAEEAGTKITGNIEDGSYVLTVSLKEDAGEWRADEMAQDDTVVKLAASGKENGVFTARYEPTGDGAVTVALRHYTEHGTCDEIHTFDLKVEGGAVTEVTSGSATAAPPEYDLDPFFSGEWLEKDTQFTALDVTKRIGDGWDIEIRSPLSHGAWVIRATAYYDCDYDAFVYADGVKYDLLPEGGTAEKPAAENLWGTLRFIGTEDEPGLEWYDMAGMNGETLAFERAPALPAYTYTGDDPVEGAIAEMLASKGAEMYRTEPGFVSIPCPIILKTEMTDDAHATVYGSFWIQNYVRRGQCLVSISGGECPAVIQLEKADGAWRVTSVEEAGDGADYAADIIRFADGDKELEEKYFRAADLLADPQKEIRTRFIRAYAEANDIGVTAYQDYGWDPVPLE